ncbi:hypothetical protein IMY05_005G0195700 [Salix suchowensis]|nr:hypothetical protein IMY05_005G0195700 [Salix suchowensis]
MVVDYSGENCQVKEGVAPLVVKIYLGIQNGPCQIFFRIWCCTLSHVLTLSSLLTE